MAPAALRLPACASLAAARATPIAAAPRLHHPVRGLGCAACAPRSRQAMRRAAVPPAATADAPAAGAAAPGLAAVTVRTNHGVPFGQVVKVVGSADALGGWSLEAAPTMGWSDGDEWLLTLNLPAGLHEFKLVVAPADGRGDATWEAGDNRSLQVPELEAAAHGAFTVVCEWGNTATSLETLPQSELDTDEAAAASSAEEAHERGAAVGLSRAELGGGYSSGSESERLAPEDLRANPEASDEEPLPPGAASVAEAAAEQTVGKVTVGKATVEGGAVPQSPRRDTAKAGKMEVEGAVPAQVGKMEVEGAAPAQVGKMTNEGGAPPTPAQQQPVSVSVPAPPAGPSTGAQLLAVAAGAVFLPVVAWSEYTLVTTGCGLPPGQGGALGALEGVSYLGLGALLTWSLVTKASTQKGLPPGPGGSLGAVEGLSWLLVVSGFAALTYQVAVYGYIPSALPDKNCFGEPAAAPLESAAPAALPAAAPAPGPAVTGPYTPQGFASGASSLAALKERVLSDSN